MGWRSSLLLLPFAHYATGTFSGTKLEVARVSCAHPTVLDDVVAKFFAQNKPVVVEANCTSTWSGFTAADCVDTMDRSRLRIIDAVPSTALGMIHRLDQAWFDEAAGDSGHTVVMVSPEVKNGAGSIVCARIHTLSRV
jgi:hypothetical protein